VSPIAGLVVVDVDADVGVDVELSDEVVVDAASVVVVRSFVGSVVSLTAVEVTRGAVTVVGWGTTAGTDDRGSGLMMM